MAKKKEEPVNLLDEINENIHSETMEEIMGTRYATYAKYVIQDRAIPDARDGLKPVQRRIIYSMYKNGNLFSRPTRKCAHTVGAVMGKYHPHGDSSIYEALVHMSQDWKVNNALIDFQGNNGSIDDDPPAAYRYTEARLSLIAEEMIRDIEKETVDMALTFDDDDFEPVVLPSRFPNLLVNGTEGIAVAMATNIPPHNLREVVDAVIYRIAHQNATVEDLMQFIPAPDFPTGGIIYRSNGIEEMYKTGRGRFEVAAKAEIIDDGKNGKSIVITEIPYDVIKIALVFSLDKLRHDKVLPGIQEVRDESDIEGIRIVIDLKKDANVEAIYNYLMSKTQLVTGFSANMVAIVNGQPKTMTLIDFIDAYIAHQVDVITRRSTFDLKKSKGRLEIVNGLIKAISILDQVVEIIRHSKDKQDAKLNLQDVFGFSEAQSEAIVMLQLYKLSNTDIKTLENEKASLEATIRDLEGILSDRKKLDRLLVSDLRKIAQKYGYERKSQIVDKETKSRGVVDKRDLIVKEETMVAVTRDGYIKRSTVKSYRSSGDSPLPGMKDGDVLVYSGKTMSTDYLICFTNLGNYLYIPIHEINENKWKEEGKHVNYLVSLTANEKIIRCYGVETFRRDLFLIIVTKKGQIKRIALSSFQAIRYSRPIRCMNLLGDDEVVEVLFSRGDSNICLLTSNGYGVMYSEYEVPKQTLKSGGVKAIKTLNGGYIACALSYDKDNTRGKFVMLTDKGQKRIFDISNIPVSKRLNKPVETFRSFKSEIHTLVGVMKIVNKDEPMTIHVLTSNKEMEDVVIDDYHLTPMDKYAKRNISLKRNASIEMLFLEADDYIDNSIESLAIIEDEEEPMEEDNNEVSLIEGEEIAEEVTDEEPQEEVLEPVDEVVETVPEEVIEAQEEEKVEVETPIEEPVEEVPSLIEEDNLEEKVQEDSERLKDTLDKMKEEEEKGYEQISIFDDTDFD